MNRALRVATIGVLLLSPVVLSACSGGQVTQTASQVRDKTGAQAQVGDISLRQVQLLSPRGGSYERGDDAELQMAIVNGGDQADTLVSIDGDGFGSAEVERSATGAATSTSAARQTGSARSQEIEIPAGSTVFIDGDAYTVTLTNLDEGLTPGQVLEVTLTFKNAGEVTLPVSVATPTRSVQRSEAFDFNQEEGSAG